MALENLLDLVKKQFIKKNPDADVEFKVASQEPPATGLIVDNPLLEFILDRRFLAFGRFYLLYGKKGSSKTSLFLDLAKLFHKNKGDVVWIETEHAIDLDYVKKQGVDVDRLTILHPDTLEQALELSELFIRNMPKAYPDGNTPVLIALDSIAGSATEDEIDASSSIKDATVAKHARLLSRFYREFEKPLANERCMFFMLNQLKHKIGAMGYGEDSADALIGGEAQFFHSTYHWKITKTGEYTAPTGPDEAERKIGSKHRINCKRNKLGREGKNQEIEWDLYIDGGIDWFSPLVRKLGKEYSSLVSKSGGYYYWVAPNCTMIDADGKEQPVNSEIAYRESDLGKIIQNSPSMKEAIRNAFGIPPLPTEVEVQEVETERKKKRGRPAKSETTAAPIEKPVTLV